jgi:hypothetical protein
MCTILILYADQEFGQERSFIERKLLGLAPNKHEMLFWFDIRWAINRLCY